MFSPFKNTKSSTVLPGGGMGPWYVWLQLELTTLVVSRFSMKSDLFPVTNSSLLTPVIPFKNEEVRSDQGKTLSG
jgi:hypothetical protein